MATTRPPGRYNSDDFGRGAAPDHATPEWFRAIPNAVLVLDSTRAVADIFTNLSPAVRPGGRRPRIYDGSFRYGASPWVYGYVANDPEGITIPAHRFYLDPRTGRPTGGGNISANDFLDNPQVSAASAALTGYIGNRRDITPPVWYQRLRGPAVHYDELGRIWDVFADARPGGLRQAEYLGSLVTAGTVGIDWLYDQQISSAPLGLPPYRQYLLCPYCGARLPMQLRPRHGDPDQYTCCPRSLEVRQSINPGDVLGAAARDVSNYMLTGMLSRGEFPIQAFGADMFRSIGQEPEPPPPWPEVKDPPPFKRRSLKFR